MDVTESSYLLATAGEIEFAFPFRQVVQVIPYTTVLRATERCRGVTGVILYGDELIPVFNPAEYLGIPTISPCLLIISRFDGDYAAAAVQAVGDVMPLKREAGAGECRHGFEVYHDEAGIDRYIISLQTFEEIIS